MFKNFIKIAIRNILKYKSTSIINIFGLAVGIASSIIIFLYAQNELNFDENNEKAESTYQVYKERITPTGTQITRDTWFPMAKALKADYPQIVNAAHFWGDESWVEVGDKKFNEQITYANNEIFDVFTVEFLEGNPESIFNDVNSAVITEGAAIKLFGSNDVLGKTLRIAYETSYTIRGVIKELPQNSSLQINILVSSESLENIERLRTFWGSSWLNTFIVLNQNVSEIELESLFPDFVEKTWDAEIRESMKLKLTPLLALYDEETNANQTAYILLVIAASIILIASINFMNLTTARSIERAKEIGLRKVLGAVKVQLIKQFLSEAVIMSMIALIAGVVFAELLLPKFNSIFGLSLQLDYLENINTVLMLALFGFAIGVISGLYPALYLSKLRPTESLKGESKTGSGKFRLNHGLIVAQFTISIVLIVGTLIMLQQIDFMKNADLKIDKDQLLVVPVEKSDFEDSETAYSKIETFKNTLLSNSNIYSVSSSSHVPGDWDNWFTFVYPDDREDTERLRMRMTIVDDQYFSTYGIDIKMGRTFSKKFETDTEGIVLNKAALKEIGWTDIESKYFRRGENKLQLLGVVEDYHFESLANKVEPVFHYYRPPDNRRHGYLTIKLNTANLSSTIDFIKNKLYELDPNREFDFRFVDENYDKLYASQDRVANIVAYFAFVGIVIACLGLFALTSFTIVRRRKEIGVRRVLGASSNDIIVTVSKEFIRLVVFSIIASIPVTYYLINKWMDEFAYKTSINPFHFFVGSLFVIAVAFITIYLKTMKAAHENPINSIKYE